MVYVARVAGAGKFSACVCVSSEMGFEVSTHQNLIQSEWLMLNPATNKLTDPVANKSAETCSKSGCEYLDHATLTISILDSQA